MSARGAPVWLPQLLQAIAGGRQERLPCCPPIALDEPLWVYRPTRLDPLKLQRRPRSHRRHQRSQPRQPVIAPMPGRMRRECSVAGYRRRICGPLWCLECLGPDCWPARCLSLIASSPSHAFLRCWSRTRWRSGLLDACPRTSCDSSCSRNQPSNGLESGCHCHGHWPDPVCPPTRRSQPYRHRRSCRCGQWCWLCR